MRGGIKSSPLQENRCAGSMETRPRTRTARTGSAAHGAIEDFTRIAYFEVPRQA